jgi:hypothetical protein
MQFVPPTHEQTPVRCSGCGSHFVSFLQVADGSAGGGGYVPDRCACGHLEDTAALPPGRLFGARGDTVKRYHAVIRSGESHV